MRSYTEHLIHKDKTVKDALGQLDVLASDAILFVVDDNGKLIGSLTDGDVRRGLLQDKTTAQPVTDFIQSDPRFVQKGNYDIHQIIEYRERNFKVLPVLDAEHKVINVINFKYQHSYLPVDALVMAGGRGSRLRPQTDTTPKPLLKVGSKTIIDHNIDRLIKFGVDDFWLSVRYLGEQLENHFGTGSDRYVNIDYVWEDQPLGTLGAASKIRDFNHDYVLVTNSDILTTLNYEDFFLDFIEKDADMSVVTIPYNVDVPYAVMETSNNHVISFKEKPTYTYYSNGGIYLIKKELLNKIPKDTFYNTTDFMQELITAGKTLISYPIRQYWLDIGKPEDFEKAQKDIKHLDL